MTGVQTCALPIYDSLDVPSPRILIDQRTAGVGAELLRYVGVGDQAGDRSHELANVARRAQDGSLIGDAHAGTTEIRRPQRRRQDLAQLLQVTGDNALPHRHVFKELGRRAEELAVDHVAAVRRHADVAGRQQARAFFLALNRGVRDFCQAFHHGSNRAEVIDILRRAEVVDDPELFKYFWGSRRASGEADVDPIVDVYDWYVKQGAVGGGIARERLVDNSFARAATARLGPFVRENKNDRTPGCE